MKKQCFKKPFGSSWRHHAGSYGVRTFRRESMREIGQLLAASAARIARGVAKSPGVWRRDAEALQRSGEGSAPDRGFRTIALSMMRRSKCVHELWRDPARTRGGAMGQSAMSWSGTARERSIQEQRRTARGGREGERERGGGGGGTREGGRERQTDRRTDRTSMRMRPRADCQEDAPGLGVRNMGIPVCKLRVWGHSSRVSCSPLADDASSKRR